MEHNMTNFVCTHIGEIYAYQYDFYRGEVDSFFPLEGEGQPNMHLLESKDPVSRMTFVMLIDALRGGEEAPPWVLRIGGIR